MRSMKSGKFRSRISAIIFVFLIIIGTVHGQGFIFNNQLAVIANDCYTRVAIGSRLPEANTTTIPAATVSDCENACSNNRTTCKAISFGIGTRGNATCQLGNDVPNSSTLVSDDDYDVYVRTQKTPFCEADRLFSLSSGGNMQMPNVTTTVMPNINFMNNLVPMQPGSMFQLTRPNGARRTGSSNNQRWFPTNDDDFRSYDIERNKNQKNYHDKTPNQDNSNYKFHQFDKIDDSNDEKEAGFFDKFDYGSLFGHKTDAIESTKGNFEENGFGNFHIGKNLYTTDLPATSGPVLHQTYLTISGRTKTGGNKGFDFDKSIYGDVPFTTKSGENPLTKSYGFVIDHNLHNVGYSGTSPESSGRRTGVNLKPVSIFELYGVDRGKTWEDRSNDSGSRFKIDSRNNHRTRDHSTGIHKVTENDRFRQTAQAPGTSVSKYSPERTYSHYSSGGNDRTRGNRGPKTCYRKIPGKKVAEVHIRNTLECERLEDCRQECEMQKTVLCEGFSYRRINSGSRGICELVSMPFSRMDLSKDFTTDPQYDYHGRDASCYRRITGPSYNNENEWRYPAPKSHLPYGPPGLTDESWRSRQPDREFSPRFGDRIPDDFYGKPADYDRRPGYETFHDDSRYNARPYGSARGQQNEVFYRRGGNGRRGPDYGDYEYRKMYPSRLHDGDSFRIMDLDDDYPRYPPKVNYFPKYPPTRDEHRYPDSMTDTNQMGPAFIVDHRKDPNRHWGYYGGTYGSQYGYDTNHISNFDPPKVDNNPHHHPRPFSNNHVYGQFYNYGGAFGYGDNYIPSDRDVIYGGSGYIRDCSVRTGAGFKITRNLIGSTYLAQNVDECEHLCHQEKSILCRTFSYRYNVEATDPTNNCLLSSVAYKDLNFYDDIEPDRNYDIYVMSKDRKNCIPAKQSSQQPPDECFWRVKSGFGMPEDVIKDKITVPGFGDCESECIKSQEFTCRSFVFRHSQGESDDSKNCFLSNWSTQEISPESLVDFDGAELYERGSFGRGCEPFPFSGKPGFPPSDRKFPHEEVCYSSFRKPCRLSPYSVTISMRVDTELDCRQKCTQMRHRDDIPCWAYSYKIRGDKSDNNCLLSDIPSRDLRPGLDYVYDDDHVLFAWKELELRCQKMDDSYDIIGPPSVPGRPLIHPDIRRPDYDDRPKPDNPPPDDNGSGYHYPRPDKGKPSFNYPSPGDSGGDNSDGYHYPRPDKGKPAFDYPPDNEGPGYHYPPPDKGKPGFYYPPPNGNPGYDYPPDKMRPGYDCPPGNENPGYLYPSPDKDRPAFDYKLLNRRPLPEYERPGSDYLPPDNRRPPFPFYGRPSHDFERPDPNRRRPYYGNRYPPPDGNHIPDDYQGVIPLNADYDKGSHGSHPSGGMSDDKIHFGNGHNDHDNQLGQFVPNDQAIFQHYSVNGYPCKRGTKCESNKITGFWSCETEGSELGSWDYCCQPTSHCGYSRGFDYPWCYVGPSEKQWRPCSEKYFPYLPSPRPIIHPLRRHQEMGRRIDDDDLDKNFLSRRWPVAYLHCEPPPGERSPVTTLEIQKDLPSNSTTRSRKWIAKSTEPPAKELRFIQAVPLIDPHENKEIENTNFTQKSNNSDSTLSKFRSAKVERITNPSKNSNQSKVFKNENFTISE